jgi:hypothetical protein
MTTAQVRVATLTFLFWAIGCHNPASPTVDDIAAQQALWSAEHITVYTFDYEQSGFFICCTEGQLLTLQVRNDTVVSAVFAATGQPVPGCPPACPGLTIDGLFGRAAQAARDHRLSGIRFDPQLHYPSLIGLAGPPDASGAEQATNLRPSF